MANKSEKAKKQLTEFWSNCTGEARAVRCAHLTNAEAQAKSHAAQRTPEFLARRSEWSKAAWKKVSPEDRLAIGAKLAEARRKKREERGLPAVAPKPTKPRKTTQEEYNAIRLANLRKGHEAKRAQKAARLAREAAEAAAKVAEEAAEKRERACEGSVGRVSVGSELLFCEGQIQEEMCVSPNKNGGLTSVGRDVSE